MKIVFTGGGTGGHIYPLIAIIREIKKIFPKNEVLSLFYVGPKTSFGLEDLKKEGVIIKNIPAGKIRGQKNLKTIFKNITDMLLRTPAGVLKSIFMLKAISPDLIFSKGGFGAFPVLLANRFFRYPLFLHESDSVPGKVSQKFAKQAKKVFVSFEGAKIGNAVVVGNPIRKEILGGSKQEAIKTFELIDTKPIVLILGGSQGAERINGLVLGVLPELLKNFEIIHQCGEQNLEHTDLLYRTIVEEKYLDKFYHLYGYLNENQMKQALAAAHIVVSRAGAASIFEIAACGKPSILIPLPNSAQNHQARNAYLYAKTGAAEVMEPQNPTPHMLYSNLMDIFSKPDTLKQMQTAALAFAKPKAGENIAKAILKKDAHPV